MGMIPYFVTEKLHIECFYSFFEAHYDSTYIFTGESHDFWECLYVLDGAVYVSADDRVYRLIQNQIIFHKPWELHKFSVDSENGVDILVFSFNLKGDLADQLENRVFQLTETQKKTILSMRDYAREYYDMQQEVKEPAHICHYLPLAEKIPEYLQIITTYIYRLFLSLISNGNISTESTEPNALLFRKAVNYLNDQMYKQPSVYDVAEFCNTSPASLQRIFNKYAGMSVHKFFQKLLIISATELLREGIRVTETAERLGFSSQAYFSAFYERETGKRPSEIK